MFVGLLQGVVGALVKVALNWSLIKLVVYIKHMWLLCILALDNASSVFDAFGAMMEAVRETSFKSMLLLVISSLINNIVFSTNVFLIISWLIECFLRRFLFLWLLWLCCKQVLSTLSQAFLIINMRLDFQMHLWLFFVLGLFVK